MRRYLYAEQFMPSVGIRPLFLTCVHNRRSPKRLRRVPEATRHTAATAVTADMCRVCVCVCAL